MSPVTRTPGSSFCPRHAAGLFLSTISKERKEETGMDQCRQLTEDKHVRRILELLGERWTLLIVAEALSGHTHFDEFEKSLGVAPSTLAVRLRLLVEIGVLERRGDRCNRLTYHLTEAGLALGPSFDLLSQWAKERMEFPDAVNNQPKGRVNPDADIKGDMDAEIR
ncbi:winged helix-turn-helix transcriptional regulator [Cupriavidus taiwanensis]